MGRASEAEKATTVTVTDCDNHGRSWCCGLRWAPLNVPLRRRLQTLSVLLLFPAQLFCLLVFGVALIWSPFTVWLRYLAIAYLVFIHVYDRDTPSQGGYYWGRSIRKLPLWTLFRDYFPIKLVRSTKEKLDPSKTYVFGYHPHGILSLGLWTAFATEALDVSTLFQGLQLRILTLEATFKLPLFREMALMHGLASCSKKSCHYLLNRGESIMLVVGGAAEALDARPGLFDLTLRNRKGFVKIALQNGASLVPCLGFGENELFNQVPNPRGSKLRDFQDWMRRKLSFSVPLFWGRGIWNYDFGILPRRNPITVVTGAPVDVPRIEFPSQQDIDETHAKYVTALQKLFDDNYQEYGGPNCTRLRIM
jgi:2-acylglycerol O-acyltransferase 2